MHPIVSDSIAIAIAAAAFVMLGWPRGRFAHRYELFVAAPPQTVWETYFVHVKKADYRPGTRVLDAEVLAETPLTVRLRLQFDYAAAPVETVIVYDLYEPFSRYQLHGRGSDLVEDGELLPEAGGTRLRVAVTGRRRGFVLPALARRRVERNQRALKDVCEGRKPEPPRPPLPQPNGWYVLIAVGSLLGVLLPLPWQVQIPLGIAGLCVGVLYLWRFLMLLIRM